MQITARQNQLTAAISIDRRHNGPILSYGNRPQTHNELNAENAWLL